MSTSNTRAKHWRSTVGKIVMAFTFASVIGGISLVPALGQENERRQRPQRPGPQQPGQQRPEQREGGWQARERQDDRRWRARGEWRGERRRHAREWRDERRWHRREWQEARRRREYQPYGYSAPIYVPPPVVYAPPRSPGISLFFPFHIR